MKRKEYTKCFYGMAFVVLCGTTLTLYAQTNTSPPPANNVIFSDNFEDDFNPAWRFSGNKNGTGIYDKNDICIVAEPNGNHVARFTVNNTGLWAPYKLGDRKAANDNEDDLRKRWSNYEFSFRWRIGKWDNLEKAPSTTDAFFSVYWRHFPQKDEALTYLSSMFFPDVWKKTLRWRALKPSLCWYGTNVDFEHTDKLDQTFMEDQELDHEWHTLRVIADGKRNEIYWDDQLYFVGGDDRAPLFGGVGIMFNHQETINVEYFDIDDVVVRSIAK